ncbi:MAG: FAD-binding oxidoreductase, partial [Actinomycetia bacterium]|nr:FAD-binding oxidoreductase [Actinomycetes bacterium]
MRIDTSTRPMTGGFQTAVVHHPHTAVVATCAEDVARAVRLAATHDLPVTVQATGHGQGAACDGGVLIDTAGLAAVAVDPASATARIGAGTPWSAVVAAAAAHGLAPVSGSFPGVGAVGYTLAGGFGLLGRAFGYASDHVQALEVVTADGQLRRVDAAHDPDLFRALRGGRGAAGIVTAMEIGLVTLDRVTGGGLFLDAGRLSTVAPVVAELMATAPDTLTVHLGALAVPDLPTLPPPMRGRHLLHVRLVGLDPAAVRRAEARVRAAGHVLAGGIRDMPWTDSGTIVGEPDHPHPFEGTNALVRGVPGADDLTALVGQAGRDQVLEIRPLGGALAVAPSVPDSVPFREAGAVVRVIGPAAPDTGDAQRRVLDVVADRTLGRAAGFLYGAARVRARAEEVYDPATLVDLRSTVDR